MLRLMLQKRDLIGKRTKKLREEGIMPAVLYGKNEKSVPVLLLQKEFEKVWKEVGESSVITLQGIGDDKEALIHGIDCDPVNGKPRHADFYIIEKGQKIRVTVPIEFIGTAPAVKELGGTLVKVLHELDIEVESASLPHSIEADISVLRNFESQLLVKDIVVPKEVAILTSPDEVVALVSEAQEEEVPDTGTADAISSIEVEKKGKQEEEGDVAAGAANNRE
jgi:large subunit ribosomal protein L25